MEHPLKLGESVKVGRSFFAAHRIIYAGEVSPGVFSVVAEWSAGHRSAAYNLYFRQNQGSFLLLGSNLTVLDASQHELRFQLDR